MGKLTRLTFAAAGITGALALLHAGVAIGIRVPVRSLAVAALLSMVLAGAAAIRDVASIWRGPVVFSFRPAEAVLCVGEEAELIRSAAQLRGTMGGAGYVFRTRLAFPAIAWGAIAGESAALLEWRDAAPDLWVVAVAAAAGILTVAFPALSFYYREVTGGRVLVYPPLACRRALEVARARRSARSLVASGGRGGPGRESQASDTPAPVESDPAVRCDAGPDA